MPRVLVVDDEKDLRSLLEYNLLQAGFTVVTAEDTTTTKTYAITVVRIGPGVLDLTYNASISGSAVYALATQPDGKLIVGGTFSQSLPVPMTNPASVLPIPVANSPNAPAVQVWLSVPSSTSPGRVCPSSGSAMWHTPL